MTTKLFEQLSSNLNELLQNNEEYNVIIEVGQEPNIHTFKVHSNILSSRCLYFKDKLAAITYNDNNMKKIKQANVSIEVFDIIIKYIYNGIISLETIDVSVIFELLIASSEFGLEELIKNIQLFLIENHTSWLRLNFSHIYQASLKNNNLKDLQQFYTNIIDKNPNIIFDSDDFPDLSENILIYILKLDNLQMNEGKIWDYVIKWGIAHNPSLPPKLDQWSEVHFLALKNSLQNCLPLIRYFQISDEDIFDKVRPYRKILDPILWEDIMLKFMAPNKNITSHILPPRINLTIVDNCTLEIESKLRTYRESYRIMGSNEESFVDLMEIEPNVESSLNNRGITYLKMKKFYESFADLNKLLEIEPDEAFALRICGVTYRIEESHLFLSIKIVSPDIFKCHQGFDLANFDNPQFPLSEVPQFKILKSEAYGAFKAMVAQKFGILAEQIRFWIFTKRANKTVRPDIPIVDNLTMTMEQVQKKHAIRQNELKLFLNVMDRPFNDNAWFPQDSFIMIFVKYFNPDSQSLKGIGHLYIEGLRTVDDIIPILRKAKEFPPYTPVKIYEEISPNMIEKLNPILTFDQSKIQNGDIICFQKTLTEEEVRKYTAAGFIHDIPTFYESILNL